MNATDDTSITRRRSEILDAIAALGPCLPGSITERANRCGNAGCACHADPGRRHGPYRLWTRKVADKTVTRTLTAEQSRTYQLWLDNARRLRELLLTELEHLAAARRLSGVRRPRSWTSC